MTCGKSGAEERVDVAIIGSGPAGASAARALRGHGLKTVIIEKAKLPRYKMCSGVLSPSSLKFISDHFGEIPPHARSTPLDVFGARVHTELDKPVIDVRFDQVDKGPGHPKTAMLVKRADFDYWLASSTDARIMDEWRLKNIEKIGDDLVLALGQDGVEKKIAAKYVVGADGALSRVRNVISPGFDKRLRIIPNYEEWYLGEIDLEPKWLNVFLDETLTTFFASVIHKDGKIIVVNGAKPPEPVMKYFSAMIEYLKQHHGLIIREKLASYGCVVHNMAATDNFHPGNGNILLAGEAGGFFRVLDEGISSALITGKAAGDAILKSAETGRQALEHYREFVQPELELCRNLNRMLPEILGLSPFTR